MPEMLFVGERRPGEPRRVTFGDRALELEPSLRLRNHSPTGFEWGYGGSGPAQLALAMLLEVASPEVALRWYQRFKSETVARLTDDRWALAASDVERWLGRTAANAGDEAQRHPARARGDANGARKGGAEGSVPA